MAHSLFPSFFLGGFECSSHRLGNGRRLDLIQATRHDEFALADYERLRNAGIMAARDGVRWHLIETRPGRYDFSSLRPMLQAARAAEMTVIWDLFHYGWPEDLNIFTPAFVDRFAAFARAVAGEFREQGWLAPLIAPVNEISFVSWGGGDVGYLNPFCRGRGWELKQQLVRAAIAATESFWDMLPQARICSIDPIIHIAADQERPQDQDAAEGYRRSMFQTWDMLSGWLCPELGGDPRYLGIIGANYYFNNQWVHCGRTLRRGDPLYRPVADILTEVWERYRRPLFVAETGVENEGRPDWLAYMTDEALTAMERGVPIEGLCLYPIVNHPGWDDDRHCHNGLWDYADGHGKRETYQPLADALKEQQAKVQARYPRWSTEKARQEAAA